MKHKLQASLQFAISYFQHGILKRLRDATGSERAKERDRRRKREIEGEREREREIEGERERERKREREKEKEREREREGEKRTASHDSNEGRTWLLALRR
jgi:hypothetical protein